MMRHRARSERGAIAVLTAVMLPVVLIAAGLAIEIGHLWSVRGKLQVQADQAAVFAASSLPVKKGDATDEKRVARQVAYYLSCHPVGSQSDLPNCPSSTTSATLDPLATKLLSDKLVTFPTSGSIKVISPTSRVRFGFGRLAGIDGANAQKSAIAKIGSPGEIEPMALSLNCLLSAAGNLPLGLGNLLTDVLPLNYIAPGPLSLDNVTTDWPNVTESNGVSVTSMSQTSTTQGIGVPLLTVVGTGWLLTTSVRVHFANGKGADRRAFHADALVNALGLAVISVPPEVVNRAGVWEVKVAVKPLLSTSWTYSRDHLKFVVDLPAVTQDILGCGRLVKSPRDQQDGTKDNLLLNLQDGLDHPISTHPSIAQVTLPSPLNVANLLNTLNGPSGIFQCANSALDVKDVGGSLRNQQVPNCMVMQQGSSTYTEFTEGMLGTQHTVPANSYTGEPEHTSAGRLVCTTWKPCRPDRTLDLTVGGVARPVNDDRFEDFILPERKNLLTSAAFFNLSTYLLPGLPVVTPDSALSPSLYSSHRFMWVPIISSPYAPNDAGVYPVLTFRPVFITQDVPSGLGFESVDMVLDLVDLWVKTALNISPSDDHGIVLNNEKNMLRALRFMTIEPSALPAVPQDYAGPVSDYIGVGPKVIRLVR
ncbi:MAG: hypothetical protein JWN84_3391 [Nocardioides sp.]|nr:hypothetical protein [Nocardioides sp.]